MSYNNIPKEIEERIVALHEQGVSVMQLTTDFGICFQTTQKILKRNGIEPRLQRKKKSKNKKPYPTKTAPEIEEVVIKKYAEGISMRQIGFDLEISDGTVRNILKRNNIEIREVRPSDEELLRVFKEAGNKVSFTKLEKTLDMERHYIAKHWKRLCPETFDRDKRGISANDDLFTDLNDEFQCWVLGWAYSDGCVCRPKHYFQITYQNRDIELDDKFKLAGGTVYLDTRGNARNYLLRSKKVKRRLLELGCVYAKSLVVEMPKVDLNFKAFLRGVFEGDGCICYQDKGRYIHCSIASGSLKFVEQIRNKLQVLNIESSIYSSKKKGSSNLTYQVAMTGIINAYRFCKYIYDGTEQFFLSRKRNMYLSWKDRYSHLYDLSRQIVKGKRYRLSKEVYKKLKDGHC